MYKEEFRVAPGAMESIEAMERATLEGRVGREQRVTAPLSLPLHGNRQFRKDAGLWAFFYPTDSTNGE